MNYKRVEKRDDCKLLIDYSCPFGARNRTSVELNGNRLNVNRQKERLVAGLLGFV